VTTLERDGRGRPGNTHIGHLGLTSQTASSPGVLARITLTVFGACVFMATALQISS
jgi:hypothetical protein